jgi:hypothetical protein
VGKGEQEIMDYRIDGFEDARYHHR